MGSQFQGVQIFMDFVVVCYPRKGNMITSLCKAKKFPQTIKNTNPRIVYALAIHEILNPRD